MEDSVLHLSTYIPSEQYFLVILNLNYRYF